MDYYTILSQRTMLENILTGRKVDVVRSFGAHALYFGFEGDQALKLSCTPDMPYLHIVEKRYIPIRNARNWHTAKLTGSALDFIEITPGDRVLTFTFDTGNRLIFEMTGRHANIILVDSEGIISGAIRIVTARQSGFREIRPGLKYVTPPSREYIEPLWAPLPVLERKIFETETVISDALASSVCSGSRLCARETLARAGIDPELPATDMSSEETFHLLKSVAEIVANAEKGGNGGSVVYGVDGLPRDVFPVEMVSASENDEYLDDINDAVIKYSRERERGLEKRNLKKTITVALTSEERSLKRTIRKIERECGRQSEPERLDRLGNTILANLNFLKKGVTTATLTDPYGTGDVEINLDPTLNGPSNAERFFTRARKLKTAAKLAEKRIAGIKNRLEEIYRERERAETLDDIKELKKTAAACSSKQAMVRSRNADQPFPRRFMSVSGLEIIVGRSDKENDALIRWAGKNDLWLHAQGVGGSHVILRTPGKKQPPDRKSIEQAASIAAYYSRAKTSAVVPVVYTQLKYVVKRKGQGPGKVTYTFEKVIFVEPGLGGIEHG